MRKSVTDNVFIRYRDSKRSRMCPGFNDTFIIRGGVGMEFFRDLESRAGSLGISEKLPCDNDGNSGESGFSFFENPTEYPGLKKYQKISEKSSKLNIKHLTF